MSTLVGTWQSTWLKQERILSQLFYVSWDGYSLFSSDHKCKHWLRQRSWFLYFIPLLSCILFLDPQVYKYKGIFFFFKAVFACSSIPLTLLAHWRVPSPKLHCQPGSWHCWQQSRIKCKADAVVMDSDTLYSIALLIQKYCLVSPSFTFKCLAFMMCMKVGVGGEQFQQWESCWLRRCAGLIWCLRRQLFLV